MKYDNRPFRSNFQITGQVYAVHPWQRPGCNLASKTQKNAEGRKCL
ncbi:hypothetical protein CLOSTHATH_03757 [Hungatella hathewayi DSM 13479]|uniref:Uncharacterized protein n=1 Tax=Hungatella hathewayi DSM 13479 TaxID=566550 RepID=D3AJG6_9FIRM|nr:hypothetical protein CLOSTHATH_03757 [Hungatella hathewayi DSM 13479]